MEDIDFLGKFIPDSKKNLKFHESQFVQYIKKAEHSKIAIILDEFNRVHPKALNILISILDEKDGMVRLNNFINNEIIEVPAENLLFFFTANFGGSYTGTHAIDSAIMNRVEISMFVDYQDDVEENIIKFLPEDKFKVVWELRGFLRNMYKENNIEPFSTRDLKNMARLISYVSNVKNVEEVFNAISPIIYKLTKYDILGYPDDETINQIKDFLDKLIEKELK